MLTRILLFTLAVSHPVAAVDITIGKPPGRMYDIGGYDLQMYCTGQGSPTVVIDTGLGSSSLEWLDIQHAIDEDTRICSYDRAGYGWSDEGPGPRTAKLLAGELHKLLAEAEIEPPYVMVGHSFGGYITQYFAETYRKEVVGMVLVESSHPEQATRLRHLARHDSDKGRQEPRLNPINNVMLSRAHGDPTGGPEDIGDFLNSRRKAIFAQMDELAHFAESGQQVTGARPLPEIPLVVLTRGQPVWTEVEGGSRSEREWQELQKELATLTSHAELRIAEQSGHHVHRDQPSLVIQAIRDVVVASSSGSRPFVNTSGVTRR